MVQHGLGPTSLRAVEDAPRARPAARPAVDGEEIYQLIKRGDVNPHEVEEVGAQAVEVSVLWQHAILHVAHLDGSRDFVLATEQPRRAPAGPALLGGLGLGAALISAGAGLGSFGVGAVGTLVALAGAGASIGLDQTNQQRARDATRFVVGAELLGGARELPLVLNDGTGATRLVCPAGAWRELDQDGLRRGLDELIASGQARPSAHVAGAHEIDVRPGGRYKLEVGGLTILARVVAPGRRVAGAARRDAAMLGAGIGSAVAVAAAVLAMRVAVTSGDGALSQGNDEDRLEALRAIVNHQLDRQAVQPEPQAASTEMPGGTGTRHAGPEGQAGNRAAPPRSARYAIRRTAEPPHLSRAQALEAVANRGILAVAAPGGAMAGGRSGMVSPFGSDSESGVDDATANGNITGDTIGDAFGYGGLGQTGTGWGAGGNGQGTVGLGVLGTMGHGSGTGPGQGYGSGVGHNLAQRGPAPPVVRPQPPTIVGLLSPEAIRRVVLRNLGQVSHCQEQGMSQDPNLEGRVVVRFIIGGDGAVMGASVQEHSLAVPSVAQCIAGAVRRWQFPAPEGNGVVTVNYPFSLERAN